MKSFYITTAIDYVNAPPHQGHAYEKIVADVIARWHRLLGEDVFFLTGTDENAQKNEQAAREAKVPVREFVDRNTKHFIELCKVLGLSNDDFIRTTEQRHVKVSQDVFTPALLHDVGKLVLGTFVKGEMEAIESIAAKGVPFVVAENMILGTDHAEIGAQILAHWNFPKDVIHAVRWHHDPDSPDKASKQMDIVYLANLLCQTSKTSDAIEGQSVELSPAVIERLGVQLDQFEEISANIAQWVDDLSDAQAFN